MLIALIVEPAGHGGKSDTMVGWPERLKHCVMIRHTHSEVREQGLCVNRWVATLISR